MAEQLANSAEPGAPTKAGSFGLIAWAAYIALGAIGRWRLALLAGAIGMAVIVAIEYRHRAVKIPDATALAFFALMLLISTAIGTWLISGYSVMVVWAMFGVVFWTTIAIGFPFTLQFAREQAPPAVWNEPIFIETNYRISLLWAIIATVNTILGIAMHFSAHPLIIGVALPTLLLIFGFVAGGWYGNHVGARFQQAGAAAG
jgi:all-trans-retinol 13,14-reductase